MNEYIIKAILLLNSLTKCLFYILFVGVCNVAFYWYSLFAMKRGKLKWYDDTLAEWCVECICAFFNNAISTEMNRFKTNHFSVVINNRFLLTSSLISYKIQNITCVKRGGVPKELLFFCSLFFFKNSYYLDKTLEPILIKLL